MSDQIQTSRHDAVLTIRMARPEKRNALTLAMYGAMTTALRDAREDANIRVVVIAGAGGAFTSGNDLHDFAATPPVGDDSLVFRFLQEISTCPKPIVAAVTGVAVGIGTTMLLHCDLVVADPTARFSLPFINLGLVPEAGSSLVLPAMLGHARASELLLLGEAFDAATAERYCIVNKVSSPGAAETDAVAWAELLASKPPEAMRLSKALLKSSTTTVPARMQEEARAFVAQLHGPEFREAMSAFIEKRAPRFS